MGRPDYDFSFFLTDDFFARKKKKQKQKHSKGDKLDTPIANTQILDHSLSWLGTCT
jgi:hypothetical protein